MLVGFMRNYRRPIKLARVVAKTSKYYNIDVVYFTPEDVDIEHKVINGKLLINNKWTPKEVPIPKFIDISTYCFKYKKEVKFLKENSVLSSARLASKDGLYKKVLEDGKFGHLIIPTANFENFYDFHKFLEEHIQIIMKPKYGQKGEDVYQLTMNEHGYTLSFEQKEVEFTKEEVKTLFETKLNYKRYIFQKYINSKTKAGDPFDCRIRLEKNGNGKWAVAIYLVRIGTGQKVVSNVAQGGSVSNLDPFLKANYGNDWITIKESIKEVAKTFPYKLEQIFNKHLTSLGIDLGIDSDGKIYLFEANTAPGQEFALGEIALLKSDYYNYMLTKQLGNLD